MKRYRIPIEFEAENDAEARRIALGLGTEDVNLGRPKTIVRSELTRLETYWMGVSDKPEEPSL